ncbi:MAG: sulfatase-like hydrolase/transferase [Planctomycetota bacterium]
MTMRSIFHAVRRASLIALCAACCVAQAAEGPAAKHPNIVYVLADDLGYGDVGCYNPEAKIATPHVDRLAREGMRFTDAHSGSAVCSPTRYGILTGRYAWRTRLQRGVLGPYDPPLIDAARLTVPALLRQHGYRTACVGKWHLGWQWPQVSGEVVFDQPITEGPTTRGFDSYFGTDVPNYPPYCFLRNDRTVGQPTDHKTEKNLDGRPGPMLPGWRFDAILPALGDEAARFIAEQSKASEPFFLYVPLTSPHEPIAPSAAFRGRSGISPLADFIMETDDALGKVLKAIDDAGIGPDTLVIFTSDNGHAKYTGLPELLARGHNPSGPLRGYKTDIWEGGHRVPFVVRWPGKVAAGSRCDTTICHTNLMATCAEILGASLPPAAGEDSVSILPLLRGEESTRPALEAVVHHSGGGEFAVRRGPWKLVLLKPAAAKARQPAKKQPAKQQPAAKKKSAQQKAAAVAKQSPQPAAAQAAESQPQAPQLYNLERDLAETTDVAAEHPEIVAELTAVLEKIVGEGRSSPGPAQQNDVPVQWR